MGFPEKSETVVTRNTGRKYVLQRLKFQSAELNELAPFVSSGHILVFWGLLLSSLLVYLRTLSLHFHIELSAG